MPIALMQFGKELTQGIEIAVTRFIHPLAPHHQLVAEIAVMGDGPSNDMTPSLTHASQRPRTESPSYFAKSAQAREPGSVPSRCYRVVMPRSIALGAIFVDQVSTPPGPRQSNPRRGYPILLMVNEYIVRSRTIVKS
jgi:hypothetical protein